MRPARFLIGGAVAATLALSVAGCGGGGSGSLSTQQVRVLANVLCKQTSAKLMIPPSQAKNVDPATRKKQVMDLLQGEIDDLGSLADRAPAKAQSQMKKMIATGQRGIDQANGDPEELLKTGSPFTAYRRLAYQYGFATCAFAI